jgi:hypothetical protein
MERTGTQSAGIAAESINGLNRRLLATLGREADADMTKARDAYEATASLKLLAQRLGLTCSQLPELTDRWLDERRLVTAPANDPGEQAGAFRAAMADAKTAARDMFAALDRATEALAPVGWQEPPEPAE